LYVGTIAAVPSLVKNLERKGYVLKPAKKNPVRKRKANHRFQKVAGPRCGSKSNPKGLVKIYDKITRVEATKGKNSAYPGQRFFHNFKRPYPAMYGTADRKTLVIK
jgi:hypothetical protein